MQYVRFGNAGMKVSRLCFGAMNFADRVSEAEAIATVHKAIDRGINFIDTADGYSRGKSEEVLGKALADGKRDDVILATKFWVKMYDPPNAGGCSRRHILRTVEDSLRRLKTDWIDLYQLHHPDPDAPVEETLATLDSLVKAGKIRYFGVSNHYAWQMAHMLGLSALHNWEPLVSLQCRYSILDRVVENETAYFCERFNVATMTYSPIHGGVLTGKYKRGAEYPKDWRFGRSDRLREELTDEVFDILDELEKIAQKYGVAMNQLAVAWVLSKPFVTTPLIGGSRPEHFDPLYDAVDLQIDPEDMERIDQISESRKYRPFANQSMVQGGDVTPIWR